MAAMHETYQDRAGRWWALSWPDGLSVVRGPYQTAQEAQEGPQEAPEAPGPPRRPQDRPGRPRTAQEAPRGANAPERASREGEGR